MGRAQLLLLFPSLPMVTCKAPQKRSKHLILFFFLSCSRIYFSLLRFGSAFVSTDLLFFGFSVGWERGLVRGPAGLCFCFKERKGCGLSWFREKNLGLGFVCVASQMCKIAPPCVCCRD
jgi:hypothetical protein